MPVGNISLQPDKKAVSRFESRKTSTLPMSSAEWANIEPAIREKCFFSARVSNAEVLGKMRELIGKALDDTKRNPNQAHVSKDKFISEMKSYLKSKGYAMGGTALTDITSRKRLGLIYQMNVDEAREYGRYVRGQDPELLEAFPAWEFTRIEHRRVPRTDWERRFRAAGGKVINGRMVALKSSDVWTNLSRFGRPYPPFDFGSGMGVVDIERGDAIKLGLIPDDEPADEIPDFDCVLETEVSLDRIPEEFREQIIKETPNAYITGNKLVQQNKPKLPTWKDMGLVDAKTWNNPKISFSKPEGDVGEKTRADARKALKDGETVSTPIGKIEFNEHIYKDWAKYADAQGKNYAESDRLLYYELAKKMAVTAREVWQQGNQMTLINIYANSKNQVRGFVLTIENNMVVRTYFIKALRELNKARKGKLVWQE